MRDEPQPVARAVARGLLDGALRGDGAILVRERARDPGDVVVRDERRERRHEPAGATPRDTRPVLVARERERTAIGDDDQLPPCRHLRATLRKELHEAEPRPAAVRAAADLDLVGDRPDDRDPEAPLGELDVVAVRAVRVSGSKPVPSSATSTIRRSSRSSKLIET